MGYVQRLATTGKVEILEKLKAEIETIYFYGIVQKIQKTLKFVPGCNKTLAKKVVNQYQSLAQQINK